MNKSFNEEIFDNLLEKAFLKFEKDLQKTYPNEKELGKAYPINRKTIRNYKRILKEKENGRKFILKYVSSAAVAILCIISLFFGVILTNSGVRASVEKVVLVWHDKYTEFIYNRTSSDFSSYEVEDFEIGYIPVGFELQFENCLDSIRLISFANTQKEDETIDIQIFDDQTSVCFDNDYMSYEKIKIGSNEAWLMYNDDEKYGSLLVVYDKISVMVVGYLSKEEIIKVARNIK